MPAKETKVMSTTALAVEALASRILFVRGVRVMLDADLAALYGVETRVLVQAVKRNLARFPEDFMFQLTSQEFADLRSQTVISSAGHGGRRTAPYAFSEHGALMAATILNSAHAVEVSVYVVRAFVQLRDLLASNRELAKRFTELERRLERKLSTHDQAIASILNAIRQLMTPPDPPKRPIGFVHPTEKKSGS
jgi:ORF6N domain-containing protein